MSATHSPATSSTARTLRKVLSRHWAKPALGVAMSLALSLGASAGFASAVPSAAAVGEVSMVLGKAWLRSADGNKQLVKRGSVIAVTDTIETGSNGHVHVRFVDQGLVVVRPSSVLQIERYEYDAHNPADSVVKLDLREGSARSISGEASHAARQNFRMNTPLAAIGVRGTDFVVSASRQTVSALVKEGAIVLAPFSSDCSAASLGPCSSNALELAGDAGQIAVLNANSLQAALLPRLDTELPDSLRGAAQPLLASKNTPEREEDGGGDIYTESVTSLAVNRKISDGRQLAQVPPPPPPPATPPPPAPPAVPITVTPVAAIPTEQLTRNTQLVWGRWFERGLATERITVSYAMAAVPGREISVGSESYGLFRSVGDVQDVNIKPGLGVIGFNLTQAQAILYTGGTRELMDVYGGLLNINFDERLFTTSLQLNHPATGKFEYSDAGRVFEGGTFRNRSDNKVTAGVLTVDGKEAGYFFETSVPAGNIEGITLWSAKP